MENEMTQNKITTVSDAVEIGNTVTKIHETPVNMLYEVPDGRGGVTTKNMSKTPRNVLLFKHGLYSLVKGDPDEIHVLNQKPYVAVSPTNDESCYVIWVGRDSEPVHTTPDKEKRFLEVVKDLVESRESDCVSEMEELQLEILDSQVRRKVVNKLLDKAPFSDLVEKSIIRKTKRGWLFHDTLLLTWESEFRNKNYKDGGYEVNGSSVSKTNSENKAFRLRQDYGNGPTLDDFEESDTMTRHTVQFGDEGYTFGQQEFEFVTRAVWALKNVKPRGVNATDSGI